MRFFAKSIYMVKSFREPVSLSVDWAGRTFEATRRSIYQKIRFDCSENTKTYH